MRHVIGGHPEPAPPGRWQGFRDLRFPVVTTVIALIILIDFFIFEGRVRVGVESRSLQAGTQDRGTTVQLGAMYGVSFLAVLLSPLLSLRGIAAMPAPIGWIGVGLMLASLALGLWAVRVLGKSYTRTLRTSAAQVLVSSGPYRIVRHPGYAAGMARLLGAGLATTNWLICALIVLIVVPTYVRRIRVEEAMLRGVFGQQFVDYSRRTWRLIPPVY